jgi:hypothetical protein
VHGEENSFWRIGRRLRGLWLGEEIPILQKILRPSAKNQTFGKEFFLSLGISRETKKMILCVLCGSVVNVKNGWEKL